MIHEKDETGSTNDDARALAIAGAPEGDAVLARAQTQGRGRAGRAWVSPEGGLYLSVIVRPQLAPPRWSLLPLAFAAAVTDALPRLAVKWPNDLLLGGRKAGGILVEARPPDFLVVGLGLNVGRAPDGVPDAAGLELDEAPRALAERLVAAILAATRSLEADGPGPTLAKVRARCVTLGKKVEWEKGEGVAVGIAEDGSLVVESAGVTHRVVAGDVRVAQRP